MIIQPALKEDAGWYTVSAKNEAGIVSSTARLDVHSESTHTHLLLYPCEDLPRHNNQPHHNWLTLTSSSFNLLPKNILTLQVQFRLNSPLCYICKDTHSHTLLLNTHCALSSAQWQQPNLPKPRKVRPSTSRYAALTEKGLDVKAAFFPDCSPLQPGGLVESDDL